MEGRGETSNGKVVRGGRILRAMGAGRGMVGVVGCERVKPAPTAAVGLPAAATRRPLVRDEVHLDGRRGGRAV